ncbi:MAG: hypothetical protein ACOYBY_08245 [Dermatophilaceae bacterium]
MSRTARLGSLLLLGAVAVSADRALRRRYHADSLAQAVHGGAAELAELAAVVRHGMSEREGELRVALGLDAPPGGAQVDPRTTRALLDDPARWRAPSGADRI